jgi:hypothetical protein
VRVCFVNGLESESTIQPMRPIDLEDAELHTAALLVGTGANPLYEFGADAPTLSAWRNPDAAQDDRIVFSADEKTADCLSIEKNNLVLR